MTATITLENVSDDVLKIFKSLAKVANVKCKVTKSQSPLDKAIKSYEKEKHTLKTYKSFDEFEQDL